RVALRDDEPPQRRAMLARDLLPGLLALVGAERDTPVGLGLGEEDAPAVLGHLHVVEMRPALGVDADRGAQIDVEGLGALRPHLAPPFEIARLPGFERSQEPAVG